MSRPVLANRTFCSCSLVAQWVGDPALHFCGSGCCCGIGKNPWSENFHILQAWPTTPQLPPPKQTIKELSAMMEMSYICVNTVAPGHMWLLGTKNVLSMSEKLNFELIKCNFSD